MRTNVVVVVIQDRQNGAELVLLIRAHVFAAERINADDTTVPVLAKRKTRTGVELRQSAPRVPPPRRPLPRAVEFDDLGPSAS